MIWLIRKLCVTLSPILIEKMRYGVIGTGAIGGYYGAKLAKMGKEVHFLFHRDYDFVKEHGLLVDSCEGSFHLEDVNAYRSTQDMPMCDVVLVGLKSVNNHLLPELLPPLLKEDTLVVLIQNGIAIEKRLMRWWTTSARQVWMPMRWSIWKPDGRRLCGICRSMG